MEVSNMSASNDQNDNLSDKEEVISKYSIVVNHKTSVNAYKALRKLKREETTNSDFDDDNHACARPSSRAIVDKPKAANIAACSEEAAILAFHKWPTQEGAGTHRAHDQDMYSAIAGGKRPRADSDDPSSEVLSQMSRSERKRNREKKRRSDVNKGFDDLMALLLMIDPKVKAEVEEKARKVQGRPQRAEGNNADGSLLINRVDLISRAVTVLERVHRENEDRKLVILDLSSGGMGDIDRGRNQDKVNMMIPMLTPSDMISRNAGAMAQQNHALQTSLAQARLAQQSMPFSNFPPGNFIGLGANALQRAAAQSTMPMLGMSSASILRQHGLMGGLSEMSHLSHSAKRQQELMRQLNGGGM